MSIIFKKSLNENEMDFVKELAKKDLERGHYEDQQRKLELQLEKINNKNIVDINLPPNHITNEAHLYLVKDLDIRIGFFVIVIRDFALEKKVCEIYMLSLKDSYKNNGYGAIILNKINNKFGEQYFLFARCLKKSDVMKKLLVKHGFMALPLENIDSGTQGFIKY